MRTRRDADLRNFNEGSKGSNGERGGTSIISVDETKNREKDRDIVKQRGEVSKAVDGLFLLLREELRFSQQNPTEIRRIFDEWSAKKDTWKQELFFALEESKGSVSMEKDELVVPILELARRSFRRQLPGEERWVDEGEYGKEVKKGDESARRTVEKLFDRYPSRLNVSDLMNGRFDVLIRAVSHRLLDDKLFSSGLANILLVLPDSGASSLKQLINIDFTLVAYTDQMSDMLREEIGQNYGDKAQKELREKIARTLPVLKSLKDLRDAMSKAQFGHVKSPDEILAIDRTYETAATVATPTNDREPHGSGGAERAKEVVEKAPPKVEKIAKMSFKEAADLLNNADISDPIEDAKRLVTPEVKAALFKELSAQLDSRLDAVKGWNPGEKLDLKIMGVLIGITADQKIYRLPLIAAEGKIAGVRQTKIEDYFKKVFGHDLQRDRRELALRRSTNIFE
ncbi:MAG: hypothetical protein UT94_C0050G0001 [Candidatus Uhrbacteria bacterium GW2011_GWF2_40_263]|nr:MAG: hypothetical protein UT94_C0050G0001 [Candidatus Uhrbacteria bacterium GW2011_GWF2_40_263]